MAALTATATPDVRADILDLLGLTEPNVVVAGFDRQNIYATVRPVSGETEKQQVLPTLVAGPRALVYTVGSKEWKDAAES